MSLLKRFPWCMVLASSLAMGLLSPAKADTTALPPLDPGYHYVTSIVVDNPVTPSGIYAVYRDGTTTSTATDRSDIVPGAGFVREAPGPDWRNSGTAPPWRRTACAGEPDLAAGTWFWNKYWQVRGDRWVLANAFWVFAAEHPCRTREPLPPVGPPSSPPTTSGTKTYSRGYPPPPPFSDLLVPARTVVQLPTEFQATGGQPDPNQGENILGIEELPTRWDFGDGKGLEDYVYRASHTYTWSSYGQPCPAECQAEIGQGLGAYRISMTRWWRALYRYEVWETDRHHDEPIYEESIDPVTGKRSWKEIGSITVADPDALLWSEVREALVESGRVRWLPVIQVKGINLGSG